MKTIINENQKGYLFKNGGFVKVLDAGKYRTFRNKSIEIQPIQAPLAAARCNLETILNHKEVELKTVTVDVPDEHLSLHFVNDRFVSCLQTGKYAFWKEAGEHRFLLTDISTPEVGREVPAYIFTAIPASMFTKVELAEYQKGGLYIDNRFARLLESGTYYFWKTGKKVSVETVDTRLTQLDITGQEILSQDKVSLRLNFVLHYRITDYVKVFTEIHDYEEQIHVAVQLALRAYVARFPLDEILESRDAISTFVFEQLKTKEKDLFISIIDAGVKDIILPGEIRDIMNTVLVAEKRAQANVITRREEVASTRSLLNTARLMEENKTLYELKKLEYLEHICEHVGSIHVTGSGDILSQLAAAIK